MRRTNDFSNSMVIEVSVAKYAIAIKCNTVTVVASDANTLQLHEKVSTQTNEQTNKKMPMNRSKRFR